MTDVKAMRKVVEAATLNPTQAKVNCPCANCGYDGKCICLSPKNQPPCGRECLSIGGGYCLFCYHCAECCRAHRKFTAAQSAATFNPEAITKLLDTIEAQAAEIERLRVGYKDSANRCYDLQRRIDELTAAMTEVVRISDRQHDAWIKAKALLQPPQSEEGKQ